MRGTSGGDSHWRISNAVLGGFVMVLGVLVAVLITGGLLNIENTANSAHSSTTQDVIAVVAFTAGTIALVSFVARGSRLARRRVGLRSAHSPRAATPPGRPDLERRWCEQGGGPYWQWRAVVLLAVAAVAAPFLVIAQTGHPFDWAQFALGTAGLLLATVIMTLFGAGRAIERLCVGEGWVGVRKLWWRRWYVIRSHELISVLPAYLLGGARLTDQWGRRTRLPTLWLRNGVADALGSQFRSWPSGLADRARDPLRPSSVGGVSRKRGRVASTFERRLLGGREWVVFGKAPGTTPFVPPQRPLLASRYLWTAIIPSFASVALAIWAKVAVDGAPSALAGALMGAGLATRPLRLGSASPGPAHPGRGGHHSASSSAGPSVRGPAR